MTSQTAAARRYEPAAADQPFLRDVIAGLTARPKHLSPKYFYDQAGAKLFDDITALPEYYPTRCELEILRARAADLARFFPAGSALIEFGSGSSRKVRLLLKAAPTIAAYVPVDISSQMLTQEAEELARDHPGLQVLPHEADFTQPFALPPALAGVPHTGFFPGSTIGNFEPHQACSFLRHAGEMLGRGAHLIIGVDLVKDAAVLQRRLQRRRRRHRAFNLNLLARINRELGGDFDLAEIQPPRLLQFRAPPHRDASRQQDAAEGEGGRPRDRVPRRRDDPHREQLQVHARILHRAGARLGLVAGRGLDRRRPEFLGACAGVRGSLG